MFEKKNNNKKKILTKWKDQDFLLIVTFCRQNKFPNGETRAFVSQVKRNSKSITMMVSQRKSKLMLIKLEGNKIIDKAVKDGWITM